MYFRYNLPWKDQRLSNFHLNFTFLCLLLFLSVQFVSIWKIVVVFFSLQEQSTGFVVQVKKPTIVKDNTNNSWIIYSFL